MPTIRYIFLVFLSLSASSQNFTWVRGHNTNGAITGTYGLQGTATASNNPGHRHGAATWVDASGNLWLFGGEGISSSTPMSWLNDLWKYNPNTNQWTWMGGSNGPNQVGTYGTQGVPANSNQPGAREFAQFWTDASGNFWLFGGDGFASTNTFGRLADLWKYNPSTNQWTWMKGPNTINQSGVYGSMGTANTANFPGARMAGATWIDASNNLWLWGGKGFDTGTTDGYLCDLWKYNTGTNNWTWIHGSNSIGQFGSYGTLGTPSNTNNPGGREHPACWLDNNGNFYLFGGRGHSTGPGAAYLGDLWKYNPTNDTWTWLLGANTNNPSANYGTQAIASASNMPGGRFAAGMWTDSGGQFWLFGGLGWDDSGNLANLNDLWNYNRSTNQWTWMKGANTINTAGIYGSMGVANALSFPGARHFNITWRHLNSRLWLLGGEGIDNSNQNPQDNMNDLWGYNPPCNPDSIVASPNKICSGNSSTLTAYNQYSANVTWFATNTGTNALGSGSVFVTPTLSATTNPTTITYYAQSNNCSLTPKTVAQLTVNPLPTITISGPNQICKGSSLTLISSGANSYTWSNGVNNATLTINSLTNNYYVSVNGENLNGCKNSTSKIINLLPLPILTSSTPSMHCVKTTATVNIQGANTYTWSNNLNVSSFTLTSNVVQNYSFFVSGTDTNGCIGSTTVIVKFYNFECVGIKENFIDITGVLGIFPNPSTGTFTLKNESGLESLHLEIYNAMGQLVLFTEPNNTQIESTLAPGIYYYAIKQRSVLLKTGKLIID